ncbi:SRPBCC family protein [Streptomyces mirabilis]
MDSIEARDSMSKSGMRRGVREGHERLDELLSGRQSGNAGRHTEKEGLRS